MSKFRRCACWVAASIALLAAPAAATDFGIGAAYWSTDDTDQALGVATKLGFRFFELRATYFSDVTADTDPERFDFEVKAIPLEAGFVFPFAEGAAFSPYVGGGAGYYLLDTTEGDIDDEVGWYAVVGTDFGGSDSGLGFNLEAISTSPVSASTPASCGGSEASNRRRR